MFLIFLSALLIFGAIGLILPGSARSAAVSLGWDANTESNLAGYKVYYGTASRSYSSNVTVGNFTSCTISGLTEGRTYYFAATAYNTGGLESGYSSEVSFTVPVVSSGGVTSYAVNCGGPQYTDKSGLTYKADGRYSGGWASSSSATISGATDPTVYKTKRVDPRTYTIPLANGTYNVTLKFAEVYFRSSRSRVFDVYFGTQKVISALDVFARAGGVNRALDITVPVTVTNGSLSIRFTRITDYPMISAIVIKK